MATIERNSSLGVTTTLPYEIGDYVEYYVTQPEGVVNSSAIEWDDNFNDNGNSGYATHHYQMIPCPFCPTNDWDTINKKEILKKNNYGSNSFLSPNYGVYRYAYTNSNMNDGLNNDALEEGEYDPSNGYYRRWDFNYNNNNNYPYNRYFVTIWADGYVYGKTSRNYVDNSPETKNCPKCHRTYKIRPTYLANLARGIIIGIEINYTSNDSNVQLKYLIQPCLNDGTKDITKEPVKLIFQKYKPEDAIMNQLGDWMGTPLRFDKNRNWCNYNSSSYPGPTVGLHMNSAALLNELEIDINSSNLANELKTALDLPTTNKSSLNVDNPQDIILYAGARYINTPKHNSSNIYSDTGIPAHIYNNINEEINLYNIKGKWIPEGGAE